jgi:hypothetical protein
MSWITDVINAINSLFTNQAFIAFASALAGAIVGSVTGYIFNSRLEKQKSKERYWIQRKNTIYSPIYKSLLSLREYLEFVKESDPPFIRIEFESEKSYYNVLISLYGSQ